MPYLLVLLLVGCAAQPTVQDMWPDQADQARLLWPGCEPGQLQAFQASDSDFYRKLGHFDPAVGGFTWIQSGMPTQIWIASRLSNEAVPWVVCHELGHACTSLTRLDPGGDHDHKLDWTWNNFAPQCAERSIK